jgi:hypothetical protein
VCNYPLFVECTKITNEYYFSPKKKKKKYENVPMDQKQTSGLSQNFNCEPSIINLETNHDDIDDGSNIIIPPLSVYNSTQVKSISTPPANSFVTSSDFVTTRS